jgi:hypothetical protein
MGNVIRFPGTWIPDPIIERMKRAGIELTAENYREIATAGDPDFEWTAEHDACLPFEIRREMLLQRIMEHHPGLTREEAEQHLDQLG